jgi:hypothetical protein
VGCARAGLGGIESARSVLSTPDEGKTWTCGNGRGDNPTQGLWDGAPVRLVVKVALAQAEGDKFIRRCMDQVDAIVGDQTNIDEELAATM